MISAADKAWVKGNSTEIIELTGQSVTRKRLNTGSPPASYDEEYGEVVTKTEETYSDAAVTVKLFWDPSEELLAKEFGGEIEAAAVAHIKADDDVAAGDFLVIDSDWYEVFRVSEAALGGYKAGALRKVTSRS